MALLYGSSTEQGWMVASGPRRAPRCEAVSHGFRDLGADFPYDGLWEALTKGVIIGPPQMPILSGAALIR
jgi:hypothetical protein